MNLAAPELLPPLARFAAEHVRSRDIDPVYPVLRWLERDEEEEPALWRSLVYVAFYNIASSETYLAADPREAFAAGWEPLRLPTGTERRALRGGHPMARHLQDVTRLMREYGTLACWLASEGEEWNDVRVAVEQAWGNGRWASYKTVEILAKVHEWWLTAPDMGNYGSSGPRATLSRLYLLPAGNSAQAVEAADEAASDLLARLEPEGVVLGVEELETILCDFGSMLKGHFYVGHDIDKMLEQTLHPTVPAEVRERVWEARAAALPHEYLGELNGWAGVSKDLVHHYALTGQVVTRAEASCAT